MDKKNGKKKSLEILESLGLKNTLGLKEKSPVWENMEKRLFKGMGKDWSDRKLFKG